MLRLLSGVQFAHREDHTFRTTFAIALLYILPIVPIRLSAQNTQRAPTIRVEVDSVFVPVLVRDAKGHTANDLTKDDSQVFDNGKRISDFGFATEKRAEFYLRHSRRNAKSSPGRCESAGSGAHRTCANAIYCFCL